MPSHILAVMDRATAAIHGPTMYPGSPDVSQAGGEWIAYYKINEGTCWIAGNSPEEAIHQARVNIEANK